MLESVVTEETLMLNTFQMLWAKLIEHFTAIIDGNPFSDPYDFYYLPYLFCYLVAGALLILFRSESDGSVSGL